MRTAIVRWTIYLIALLAAGPAAGWLTALARGSDGGPGTPLTCVSPAIGIAAAFGAVGIALLVGLISIRVIGAAHAMTASGYILAWASWRTAQVDDVLRCAGSGSPLTRLALEGAILGIAGVASVILLTFFSRDARSRDWSVKRSMLGQNAHICILVGTIAGAVAAWLIAATPLKGQAVFAGVGGAIFAAAACRLVQFDAPVVVMMIPVTILATLSPVSAMILHGTGGAVAAAYKGSLFPLSHVTPLDWIAGGMLGIPIGVSWAGSMIEKRTPDSAPAPAHK